MTSDLPQRKPATVRIAAWCVTLGFVLQLAAGNCGCFEHNGWVQLFQSSDQNAVENHVDERHVHDRGSHSSGSHGHPHDSGNIDADTRSEFVQHGHECNPLATTDAVLAQVVRLPSHVVTASIMDNGRCMMNGEDRTSHRLADESEFSFFRDGPARFVTQAFLL